MAVGKLSVTPVTARSIPSIGEAKLFVGCFIQETEKHRTHSVDGREPSWKNSLTCNVPEGQNTLTIELVNENPNHGGLLAYSKVELNHVFNQGSESKWVQLISASNGQPFGELQLNLVFNGSNTVSSVTSSFGNMSLQGDEQVAYKQSTTQSQTSVHHQSESRQGSYSSLGPANPLPDNYGTGTPPPFTPPAPIRYNSEGSMPGTVNTDNMTKEEFDEAKSRGTIPTWAKYGGGVLAGAAAIGLTAWGAHELKEHFEKKEEEEKLKHKHDEKPFVPPVMHHQAQNMPYKNDNQPPQYHAPPPATAYHAPPPATAYHAPPQQQHHSEHKEKKKEKGEKKKKKKDRRGSGSDSDSSSSDSDSDSDSDHGKKKKDKHHKHKDSQWR
ncbi:hypothetical protein G6F23_003254 [Rhizopus arrhizus]|nr:hypothetical protein G6F23_003254 [Rhizopus arrhizus]